MAFKKLILQPGLNIQRTPLLNQVGWSLANLIRWREGLPEVIGGWVKFMASTLQGVCRGAHAWTTLAGINTLGAGTSQRLYVIQGNQPYDVTPVLQTTTPTNPYSTTNGSPTVTVVDTSLTLTLGVGCFLEISNGTAVGGLTLAGEYAVASIISATSYTITASGNATSTVSGGGGTPTLAYLLPVGATNAAPASGWGLGTWGTGTWGTARASTSTSTFPTLWTIDNYGEQMIACCRGNGIFVWLPGNGTSVRASAITNAPIECNAILVSNGAEQVIALGCIPPAGGVFNPMLVAWTDYGNYTTWVASATNAAGSYPLTDGSQIMAGARAGQQMLIWTDTALYSMQFLGGTSIYGFTQLGTGCGLISPQAAGLTSNLAFWMSGLNFMWYNGTIQVLDCPVRDAVYRNLNTLQAGKVICGMNTQFSEVRWDYPSASATENDSYVIFNYAEGTWTLGGNGTTGLSIARTAWVDYNVFGNPLGFDANGVVWAHESGYSAGPSAMPWYLVSGAIDLAEGEQAMFVDMLIPDQVLQNGSMAIWIYAQNYPNDAYVVTPNEPFQVTSATEFIPLRLRGRQFQVRFDNSFMSVGVFWRLGALRVRLTPDGRLT